MKLLLLSIVFYTHSLYALVSISPVEIGDKSGFSVSLETGMETKRGNTNKDNYRASLRVSYDEDKKCVLWGEIFGEYGKSNAQEDTKKAFSHIRYIHSLTDNENIRYEIFSQLESDAFRQINNRILGGLGLRYRYLNSEKNGKGYFGFSIFSEYIKYKNNISDPSEVNSRLNAYASYKLMFNENSSFAYTLYYQPKFNDSNDYIQTNNIELKFNLYKKLLLKLNTIYNIDTNPPSSVVKYDFTQRVSFVYNY